MLKSVIKYINISYFFLICININGNMMLDENDKLTITLKNNSHLPSNFINAAWQGYYVTATERV